MTNQDRLISFLGFAPSKEAAEGALIDAGIAGNQNYLLENSVPLKKAAIELMELLLTTADTGNENGYTIKYDRAAVLKRLNLLRIELGVVEEGPYITSKVVW